METPAAHFVDYLHQTTGQEVLWQGAVVDRFPQFLAQEYGFYRIKIGKEIYLAIVLKNGQSLRPAVVAKHITRILDLVPELQDYCLFADDLPAYVRQRLVDHQIPFVVPGRQLYWPSLGMAVKEYSKTARRPVSVETVKPATQVVLLGLLNDRINLPITPKQLAEQFGYTQMTMTRALDEIQGNSLGQVTRVGKQRLLDLEQDHPSLWQRALPVMINPVRKTIRIEHSQLPKAQRIEAGETALGRMGMLTPPREPSYAAGPKAAKKLLEQVQPIPIEDEGTCQLQQWYYDPQLFSVDGCVDRFSLYLSLQNQSDERVQIALEELMKELS